jgi:hypothetical protein
MSNYDDMPAEQAVWAYSSMLYDSRQERDSLRRELNIVITQLTDLQADYQRLASEYERIARAVYCPDCESRQDANNAE